MIIKNKQGTVIFDGADLSGANLSGANLSGANLSGANLSGTNLSWANLSGADLSWTNLSWANLSGADLSGADLSGADLHGANLSGADLDPVAIQHRTILPDGDLIGWKKLANGTLAKLQIPANAKRVGGLTCRKCRAEFAVVLEGDGFALCDSKFHYKPGQTVKPTQPFNDDPREVCASGIHFYITRIEAEQHC